jgi:hypothetical protein
MKLGSICLLIKNIGLGDNNMPKKKGRGKKGLIRFDEKGRALDPDTGGSLFGDFSPVTTGWGSIGKKEYDEYMKKYRKKRKR